MKTIDVAGLPEPVAEAIEGVVRSLQNELEHESPGTAILPRQKVRLRTRPGHVIGRLSREEIYENL